jgi:hypothetical protein
MCHTSIKPDLLCFPGIGVFACGLLDHVVKRFQADLRKKWWQGFLIMQGDYSSNFNCVSWYYKDLKRQKRRKLIPTITFLSKKAKNISMRSKSYYNLETTWATTFPLVSRIIGWHGRLYIISLESVL